MDGFEMAVFTSHLVDVAGGGVDARRSLRIAGI
jgi:hypothetical protein